VDRIKEMLDQLSELDDAQVAELQSEIISEFESVEKETPTKQTVDAMTALADMLDSVRSEVSTREVAAQELAQQASEASARVYGQDASMEDPEALAEGEEIPEDVIPESENGMPFEEPVDETIPPAAPMEGEEVPEDETPAEDAEEDPEDEMPFATEEDDENKEFTTMSEASTVADETIELSTETEAAVEVEPVVEAEPVVASADETVVETPEAELAAEETTASLEVAEGAEAAVIEPVAQSAQEETNMEAPVTAAADPAENLNIEAPADRRPVPSASAAPVAITAGADIPGYTAGSSMNNMDDVAEAMSKRIHSLRRVNGGDGEQHIVASITTQYPDERTLGTDPEANWEKIQNVVGPEALVAAGGHQAPFEVKYDIFGFGTDARPVRDALAKFQADRGGIRYITPPVLSDYVNATGVWTAANDAAQTPSPAAKASLTVAAAQEVTVATDAVTLQMQFGNLVTRAYPELVARHNELGLIQHARRAEQNLLAQLTSNSTAVTTSSLIGFGRDFLVQVGRAAAAYRSRHRLEADTSLRIIVPSWVKDAMVADLALQMPGDSTLNAYGEVDGYLAARNVVASYTLDQDTFGAQSAGALLEFPDSFVWYLFAEGTFLMLDGGTLDIGIIRDSGLVGTNDYKMFLETFEAVAKVGIEGLVVTSSISINGVAAALRDTTGGATAAAIEY
jgi:chemotaxis protein histidine kinase CheA